MGAKNAQQEVSIEAIDAALDNLVKAVEANDLIKAYAGISIDQGGHTDERGQTSGGYADSGDMGGMDPMMIGKMQEALVDAGFSAASIAAFMSKKKGEDEEEEEDDEEDGEGEGDEGGGFGKMTMVPHGRPSPSGSARKSRTQQPDDFEKALNALRSSEHIAEAVDISPFMEDFVEKSAQLYGDLVKAMRHGQASTDHKMAQMGAAIYGTGQLLKSIMAVTDALNARLALVEQSPTPAKGARTLSGARAMHKSITGEVGGAAPQGQGQGAPMQLTKSQIVSTLTYMNLEKGMREIGGISTVELAGMLEAGNQLHPTAAAAVQRFIQTHPHEAETALRYH